MGVTLGNQNAVMAKQAPNRLDVRPSLKKAASKRPPQVMKAEIANPRPSASRIERCLNGSIGRVKVEKLC